MSPVIEFQAHQFYLLKSFVDWLLRKFRFSFELLGKVLIKVHDYDDIALLAACHRELRIILLCINVWNSIKQKRHLPLTLEDFTYLLEQILLLHNFGLHFFRYCIWFAHLCPFFKSWLISWMYSFLHNSTFKDDASCFHVDDFTLMVDFNFTGLAEQFDLLLRDTIEHLKTIIVQNDHSPTQLVV